MDRFSDPLPDGTTLLQGQYHINSFLNDGGFGITYLASDSLDRPMVIKECFPRAICRRSGLEVGTRAISHRAEFRSIVKAFEEEARNLSKFEHPNIVKVHQVFDENQTAYMAMDYVDGHELVFAIEQGRLTPIQITSIAINLLDALENIHAHGMLHRDISPDNILLDQDNNPVLIDFGAAKEEASQHGPKMTSIRVTKEGYSPQEFYVSGADQFPSSDLYAFAATIYHAITGSAPPESQARLLALAQERPDPYVPLSGQYAQYPSGLLKAIDLALNVSPKDRLPTAKDWLALIHEPPINYEIKPRKALLVGAGIFVLALISYGFVNYTNPIEPLPKPTITQAQNLNFEAPSITHSDNWSIEIPFTLNDNISGDLKIAEVKPWFDSKITGEWIKSGVRILSVNNQELAGPDALADAALQSQGNPFPIPLIAKITYIPIGKSQSKTSNLQLNATQSFTFSNGMKVRQQYRGSDWQLIVLIAPASPAADLQTGDILLAERVLGAPVTTLDDFLKTLQTLEDRNLPKGVFSVRRDNDVLLANLALSEIKP
jgi:serine/threonine protein kinase